MNWKNIIQYDLAPAVPAVFRVEANGKVNYYIGGKGKHNELLVGDRYSIMPSRDKYP